MGGRQVLSEKSIDEMETVRTTLAARAGLSNGYGLGNEVDLQFPLKSRGHDGGMPGFSAHYRYFSEQGLGCALLFNTAGSYPGRQRIHRLVFDFVTRGVARPQPPRAEPSEDELTALAGYYAPANPKDQLFAFRDALFGGVHVWAQSGKLLMQAFRQPEEELVPVERTLFRRTEEPEASIVFTKDSASHQVLVADAGWSYFERTGAWRAYLHRALVFGALALMASAVLFAMVWMPLAVFRRNRAWSLVGPRVSALLGALSFFAWFRLLSSSGPLELGTANPTTVTLCVLTLLFAGLSAYGLLLSIKGWSLPGRTPPE